MHSALFALLVFEHVFEHVFDCVLDYHTGWKILLVE